MSRSNSKAVTAASGSTMPVPAATPIAFRRRVPPAAAERRPRSPQIGVSGLGELRVAVRQLRVEQGGPAPSANPIIV